MSAAIARDILEFWFAPGGTPGRSEYRDVWFNSTPEFDAEIESRFAGALADAAAGGPDPMAGGPDPMADTPQGALALVIMLDQFPRNLFRATPRAFATDANALAVAKTAVAGGFDDGMTDCQKLFLYLPFEHSENLGDQDMAVKLFADLDIENSVKASIEHRDTIRRFGRFPHRNAILGRKNTPEEDEYLKDAPAWGLSGADRAKAEAEKAEPETEPEKR